MEKQTLELLKECSSGCKMAIDSMDQIKEYVLDTKLSQVIEAAKKQHLQLEKEVDGLLREQGERGKEPEKMAQAFSWITTEMKLMIKDDNTQIAKILMDGCNMGIKSLSEQINKYPEASRESRAAAEKIVKCEEKLMGELKKFL
ncbi:MAG TPA: hypothetical protein H9873_10145 [Candidatus Dorea gallistercoris]|uniref:DUF2383 domain-containing protein n=1 Tax=Candidatus Dorea gallistercoris TaxID=2838542 RepID=A0A9D1RAD4_9FIRM|nr:hypothetical protein [Candidatus Dorea gallistercoris]